MLNVYRVRKSLKQVERDSSSTYFKIVKIISYIILIASVILTIRIAQVDKNYDLLFFIPLLVSIYFIFDVYPKLPLSLFTLKLNENGVSMKKYHMYVLLKVLTLNIIVIIIGVFIFNFEIEYLLQGALITSIVIYPISVYSLLSNRMRLIDIQNLNHYQIYFVPLYLLTFISSIANYVDLRIISAVIGPLMLFYTIFISIIASTILLYRNDKYKGESKWQTIKF